MTTMTTNMNLSNSSRSSTLSHFEFLHPSKRQREHGRMSIHPFLVSQEDEEDGDDTAMETSSSSPVAKRARTSPLQPLQVQVSEEPQACHRSSFTTCPPPSPSVVSHTMETGDDSPAPKFTSNSNHHREEWWKRSSRSSNPLLPTIPDGSVLCVTTETSSSASDSIKKNTEETNCLVCIVCQTLFVPTVAPEAPQVMKPNALLNYFSVTSSSSSSSHHKKTTTAAAASNLQTHSKNRTMACTFCERPACQDCLRDCEECRQRFCSFCTSQEYGWGTTSYSRTVCADCSQSRHQDVQSRRCRSSDENDDEDGSSMMEE